MTETETETHREKRGREKEESFYEGLVGRERTRGREREREGDRAERYVVNVEERDGKSTWSREKREGARERRQTKERHREIHL